MTVIMTSSERDLCALARIVSDDRGDFPAEGLAPSLLRDLAGPHLHQAYLDAKGHHARTPRLTSRQRQLMCLVAAGHTNAQAARRMGLSEATVRKHLEKCR